MPSIDLKPRLRRISGRIFAEILLALIVVASIAQYLQRGEVSWITDSFRFIETRYERFTGTTGLDTGVVSSVETRKKEAKRGAGPGYDLKGRVYFVKDGDSVMLMDSDWVSHEIRLGGIDAPERDQPHGQRSKYALAKLILGRTVDVDVTGTDKYHRTIGSIVVDGSSVDVEMVRSGNAWWYRYFNPDNRELAKAEKEARQNKRGLWQDEAPIPPWDWRRGKR